MIRPILAALALTFTLAAAHAQAPDQLFTATHEQLDVTKVLLAQEAAWNKGDLDAYLSHYKDAPDTQAILAAPVRGLSNIRAAFHLNFPSRDTMGTLDQSEVEVRELGPDYGLATGKYHLTRPKKFGGDTDGTFMEILQKTPAGWMVIFSQTS
jgi:ketosteroid isomerase-like protein